MTGALTQVFIVKEEKHFKKTVYYCLCKDLLDYMAFKQSVFVLKYVNCLLVNLLVRLCGF